MNDSNIVKRTQGVSLLIIFLAIIMSGFIFSILNIKDIIVTGGGLILSALRGERFVSEIPITFEAYYDSLYSSQPWSLDAFSFTQRILGKHETRNFEVLRANDGALYLCGSEENIDVEQLRLMADECELMFNATKEYGGHFLYVQAPFKNVGQVPELADYSLDTTEANEDCLVELIKGNGIPTLDLRSYNECVEYYNTDHHWTTKAAFNASKVIGDEIERVYGIHFEGHDLYGDMSNYDPITYDNSFLGSIGIKVGPHFGGRDDFTIYNPKFDTDFRFVHYIDDQPQFEQTGVFWETFINQEMLEDNKYNNKYNANMYGAYAESIINNHMAQNDYKGLLITNSYGRSMAPYMCLDYSELRYLDPQKERFDKNLVDYIRKYQPDVVVFMFNGIVNVGDGNWPE